MVNSPVPLPRDAKIEWHAGKFVLFNQSSNRTSVMIGDAPEIGLKREKVIPFGSGHISFGQVVAKPGAA